MRYVRSAGSSKGPEGVEQDDDDDEADEERLSHPLAVLSVKTILARPWTVLLAVFLLFCACAYGALELEGMKGPPMYIRENDDFKSDFPASERQRDVLVIWCRRGCEDAAAMRAAEELAEAAAERHLIELRRDGDGICADLRWSSGASPRVGMRPASYEKGGVRIMEISAKERDCIDEVRETLADVAAAATGGNTTMALAGLESVAQASMEREGDDAWGHMAICVPFVAAVLMFVLGNVIRPLTAIVCMAATFAGVRAFLVVAKLSVDALNINEDDQAMFFIAFALNSDYALFFWSRFAEERAKRPGADQYMSALEAAFLRSGAVISISNLVMAFAFCGTLFIPGINQPGQLAFLIECTTGVVLAALFSLSLTPALAAAFPSLFDEGRAVSCFAAWIQPLRPDTKKLWTTWARTITTRPWLVLIPSLVFGLMVPFLVAATKYQANLDIFQICANHMTTEYQAYEKFSDNFNVGKVMPISYIFEAQDLGPAHADDAPGLLATSWLPVGREAALAAAPAASNASARAAGTAAAAAALPGTALVALADEVVAENEATAKGGSMSMLQRESIARYRHDASHLGAEVAVTLLAEFGREVCDFVDKILWQTRGTNYEIRPDDVAGIWWLPGIGANGAAGCAASWAKAIQAQALNDTRSDNLISSLGIKPEMVRKEIHERTSFDGSKTLLSIYPRFAPTGRDSADLSHFLRDQLEKHATHTFEARGRLYQMKAHHESVVASELDQSRKMLAAVPWITGIVMFIGFCSVGLTFGAAFLPFKLALTVAVPLFATYGFVTAFFQLGWFRWLGLGQIGAGPDPLLFFTTPCGLFGLAMDYDLFLFVRVYEYRRKGYDNRSAVRRALVETGPVITAAGVLFMISLLFLTMSHTPFMVYVGAIYLTGICMDVFIIRTCIAPAFLCVAETLNYWPSEMPPATKAWPKPVQDDDAPMAKTLTDQMRTSTAELAQPREANGNVAQQAGDQAQTDGGPLVGALVPPAQPPPLAAEARLKKDGNPLAHALMQQERR